MLRIAIFLLFCLPAFCSNTNSYTNLSNLPQKVSLKIDTEIKLHSYNPDKSPIVLNRSTQIFRDNNKWDANTLDFSLTEDSAISYGRLINKRNYYYTGQNSKPADIIYIDSDIKSGVFKLLGTFGAIMITEGHIPCDGDQNLDSLIKQSNLSENKTVQMDQKDLIYRSYYGPYGNIEIWEQKNNKLYRVIITKKSEHILNGKKVADTKIENQDFPKSSLTEYIFEANGFEYTEIGNKKMLKKCVFNEKWIYPNNQIVNAEYCSNIENIDIDPNFEALNAFKIRVPDGTQVHDFDFDAGDFVVMNGQIVSGVGFYATNDFLEHVAKDASAIQTKKTDIKEKEAIVEKFKKKKIIEKVENKKTVPIEILSKPKSVTAQRDKTDNRKWLITLSVVVVIVFLIIISLAILRNKNEKFST